MKKRKLKKKALLGIIIILLIIIIILILVLKPSDNSKELLGIWEGEGKTTYKFLKDGTGEMSVPLNTYAFTYKIEDNKISIDFKNEKVNDADYEYTIKESTLTLKGIRGTFKFTKK